jgi:hypothetical protein
MGKRVIPILLHCDYEQLPERLRRFHAMDFHNFERYLTGAREREGLRVKTGHFYSV